MRRFGDGVSDDKIAKYCVSSRKFQAPRKTKSGGGGDQKTAAAMAAACQFSLWSVVASRNTRADGKFGSNGGNGKMGFCAQFAKCDV